MAGSALEKLPVLEKLQGDIAKWQCFAPAMLHPLRALSFVRVYHKVPAQKIADVLGISRSYVAALENYTKPVTDELFSNCIAPLVDSLKSSNVSPDIAKLLESYFLLIPQHAVESIFGAVAWLEQTVTSDLAYMLAHYIFEALTSSPYVEIIWENPLTEEVFSNLTVSEGIEWPSAWPERRMPRMILTSRHSIILSWLAGFMSTEEVVNYYAGKYHPAPQVLMQRKFSLSQISTSALIALATFLFDSISIEVVPGAYLEPAVHLSVVFNKKRLSFAVPGITWFTIDELVKLKDVKHMFSE